MSLVTGLTAARMLAIEAASVVSGLVSGDNLILTKRDGTTINAGNVRGATGYPGISAQDLQGQNLIINPEFTINQRGFTYGQVNNVYTLDRWGVTFVGGSMMTSVGQSDVNPPFISGDEEFTKYMQFNPGGSLATHHSYLWQKIEGIRTLAGKKATISFWARTWDGTTAKVGVTLVQDFGLTSEFDSPAPFTDTETSAGYVNVDPTWKRYSLTVDVPSLAAKYTASNYDHNLTLRIYLAAGTSFDSLFGTTIGFPSNAIFITGVKLEENILATKFVHRPVAEELRLCRRYYQYYSMASGRLSGDKLHVICMPMDLGDMRLGATTPTATVEIVTYGGGALIANNPVLTVAGHGQGSSEILFDTPSELIAGAIPAGWTRWNGLRLNHEL